VPAPNACEARVDPRGEHGRELRHDVARHRAGELVRMLSPALSLALSLVLSLVLATVRALVPAEAMGTLRR
jgi:hypothetical protein